MDDYALPLPPLDLEGEGPDLLSQSTGLATTQGSCIFHTVSERSLNEGSLRGLVNQVAGGEVARAVAQCSEEREEGVWCLTAATRNTLVMKSLTALLCNCRGLLYVV